VVQKSDSFWSIAQEKYGTPRYFRALAQFNAQQVPDPLTMRPGIRIVTPSAFVLESRFPDLVPKQPNSNRGAGASGAADLIPAGFFRDATRGPQYRVGKGDTLTAIAYQHLGSAARWMQIFAMNQDVLQNPNSLKIGTVLRLPRDAREVRVATQPAYSR
jgi:nucleoid-associated protein YgaU